MSWKFVLDGNKVQGTTLTGRSCERIADLASRIGYDFFLYKDCVYFVTPGGKPYKTSLTVNDLY